MARAWQGPPRRPDLLASVTQGCKRSQGIPRLMSTTRVRARCASREQSASERTVPYGGTVALYKRVPREARQQREQHHLRCKGPHTHIPVAASGTFSSLYRVLCTLRSLYLCTIGLIAGIQPYEGHTSQFELQSQGALLLRTPQPVHHERPTDGHGASARGCHP